jgi:hypothetical protein
MCVAKRSAFSWLYLAHGPGVNVYWRIGRVTIFGLFLFFIGSQIELSCRVSPLM